MDLQEIDSAKITLLVDNITDRLLTSSSIVIRPSMISNQRIAESPIAEHGFSAILDITYTMIMRPRRIGFYLILELVKVV